MLFDEEKTLFYPKSLPNGGIERLMSVYGIHFGFFGTLETLETVRSIKTRSSVQSKPYMKATFKDVGGRNYINGLLFADEKEVETPDADEIVWVLGYYNPKFRTLNIRAILSVNWFPEHPEGMTYWEVVARNLNQGIDPNQCDPENEEADNTTKSKVGDSQGENVFALPRKDKIHGS